MPVLIPRNTTLARSDAMIRIAHVRRFHWLLLAGALLGLPAEVASQEPSPVTLNADVTYANRYLFAGIPFSGGDVLQGHAAVAFSGFTFHFFSNYDFDTEEFNELDVYADYFAMLSDMVGAYIGGAIYNFKNVEEVGEFSATPEVYGGISIFTTLTPSIYVAHDFDLGDGTHVYFSLSHPIPAGPVTITGTGRIEYNADYWREGSDFSFADLLVSVDIPAGAFTFSPFTRLQLGLADDFGDYGVVGVQAAAAF